MKTLPLPVMVLLPPPLKKALPLVLLPPPVRRKALAVVLLPLPLKKALPLVVILGLGLLSCNHRMMSAPEGAVIKVYTKSELYKTKRQSHVHHHDHTNLAMGLHGPALAHDAAQLWRRWR